MNWDSPEARLALVEQVGVDKYNAMMKAHRQALPTVYPVATQFGRLWAVKGSKMAYRKREDAEREAAKVR